MKNLKFDTGGDLEVSREIQELLFSVGVKWRSGATEPQELGKRYLSLDADSEISFHGADLETFEADPATLCTLDELRAMVAEIKGEEVKHVEPAMDFGPNEVAVAPNEQTERLIQALNRVADAMEAKVPTVKNAEPELFLFSDFESLLLKGCGSLAGENSVGWKYRRAVKVIELGPIEKAPGV